MLAIVMGLGGTMVYAATPTVSLSAAGNGDSVTAQVYGDPYAGAYIYYQRSGFGYQSQYLGTTNASGFLSAPMSTSGLGITSGSSVYVMVNNQQSPMVAWPYTYGTGTQGSVYLSPSSVSVTVGQTATVSISGGYGPYTQYGSTNNTFQSVIGGNSVTISGLATGSGSVQICSSGTTGCSTLYVTVTSQNYNPYPTYAPYPTPYPYYGYVQPISFSQNSVSLSVGQSSTVTVSGGSGSGYYVAYNSGSGVVQTSINGNVLSVSGTSPASAGIVVCSSSSSCGGFTVTVGQSGSYNPGNYGSGNWIFCGNENQPCNFSGTQVVRYGANGSYSYRTVTSGTICSNAAFGDPAFGYVKQCYYGGSIGY